MDADAEPHLAGPSPTARAAWTADLLSAAGGDPPMTPFVEPVASWQRQELARRAWTPARELLQLRCALPRPDPVSIPTRAFRPGTRDEADWLAVNNRAFAWHPEQADRTPADLHAKMAEPWFDPTGFLLHHEDGRLVAFCWTKVHPASDVDPALGEIFVIGVDPDAAGRGLGRQMTLAGLAWLAEHGLHTGMLYVESDNETARRLYVGLGFVEHHRAVRFVAARTPSVGS